MFENHAVVTEPGEYGVIAIAGSRSFNDSLASPIQTGRTGVGELRVPPLPTHSIPRFGWEDAFRLPWWKAWWIIQRAGWF